MIFSNGYILHQMYGLHAYAEHRQRRYGILLQMQCQTLVLLGGVCRFPLKRYDFLMILEHKKGGTVVPPCDFQPIYLKTPLNKGTPRDFPSGARPPARAARSRAQPHPVEIESYINKQMSH